MRTGLVSAIAATLMVCAGCGGATPGSPEWCKNTPLEEQVKNQAAMAECVKAGLQDTMKQLGM